jgi:RNA polymerase sigma-70 factor, ECF subfamily
VPKTVSRSHSGRVIHERVSPALVERARAGCEQSFGALFARLRERVRRVAFRILRDEHEAEDAAQEAFFAAYRGLGRLDDAARFEPWLLRIVTNVAINRRRRNARCRPAPRVHDESLDGARELGRVISRSGAAEPSPVALALLRAEIEALGRDVRETVELRYQRGLSCSRIARTQGVSLSCVKTRLHRARHRLAEAARAGVT